MAILIEVDDLSERQFENLEMDILTTIQEAGDYGISLDLLAQTVGGSVDDMKNMLSDMKQNYPDQIDDRDPVVWSGPHVESTYA